MNTVILGFSGALVYGIADFLGGMASRRVRPIIVTSFTATAGILPLLVGLLLLGGRFTSEALLWGLVAGISGSVGVLLLYVALAIGPMSILSPLTAVFAALIPVLVGVAGGTVLSPLATAAIVLAIVSVILVATVRDTTGARVTPRGLLCAVLAGCGFGGLVLAYNATSPEDGVAPLIVARIVQAILMAGSALLVIVAARHRGAEPQRGRGPLRSSAFWLLVVICGVCDATANVFIQAALHSSTDPATLPVVSVLNALYPIGTVLLASIVLRERMTALQILGIVGSLAAGVGLALG